jgi:hypothetical protein
MRKHAESAVATRICQDNVAHARLSCCYQGFTPGLWTERVCYCRLCGIGREVLVVCSPSDQTYQRNMIYGLTTSHQEQWLIMCERSP